LSEKRYMNMWPLYQPQVMQTMTSRNDYKPP